MERNNLKKDNSEHEKLKTTQFRKGKSKNDNSGKAKLNYKFEQERSETGQEKEYL